MTRPRRRLALALLAAAVVVGCGSSDEPADSSPARDARVAGFSLLPLPAEAMAKCRENSQLGDGVSCPSVFPRPPHGRGGEWFFRRLSRKLGPSSPFSGIDMNFFPDSTDGLPTDTGLIHFTLHSGPVDGEPPGYASELPRTAKAAVLGGRQGIYAPATGSRPCCNHAIFVWTEGGRRYAASLHTIGPVTRQVFDALLEHY